MLPTEILAVQNILPWNPLSYRRRRTRVVKVGAVAVGGDNPLRVQSMTTTSTMDTDATVDQVLRLADVGCEIARITAPTINEARNLEKIKSKLLQKGCVIPLVADIHFRPDAAMIAADFVEKVRVNPGNFVDGKAFKVRDYTDEEYAAEVRRIEDKFTPLVLKLKNLGRSVRIGTNHGSLSDRIMNRFGDTPLGMVESALEFVRICEKNDYRDIIISMKASNPRVMIAAYRMLAARMAWEGMDYPFHLGVTEAGDGEDGRIKSAAGIGSLLEDGIGDTIRVSLTEDPEFEIPVAQELARRYKTPIVKAKPEASSKILRYTQDDNVFQPARRATRQVFIGPIAVGGSSPLRIVSQIRLSDTLPQDVLALLEERLKKDTPPEILVVPYEGPDFEKRFGVFRAALAGETQRLGFVVSFEPGSMPPALPAGADAYLFFASDGTLRITDKNKQLLMAGMESSSVHRVRTFVAETGAMKNDVPLLLVGPRNQTVLNDAVVFGSLVCDGIGDAVWTGGRALSDQQLSTSYNFLQACGSRITKTEYVSCPSCGRTLFDLQSTTERIKSQTGHLKGVKIAIMGCIVNGPGEMADADFGYVGGGPGKINLYVGKECVEKSIPSEIADQKLIELIKTHGKWTEPV
jgi:(E)-4-hydroxy-3-methylbut-2-enyl-diphosphate synthase